jgi:hypothetical protein
MVRFAGRRISGFCHGGIEVVPHERRALSPPVWKTGMLGLLTLMGLEKVALVGNAPTSPRLQRGANLSQQPGQKMARMTGAAPARSRSTGEYRCCSNSCAKSGPPRCCPALYRLRGDCIAAMLADHGPPVWRCPIVCG